MLIGSQAIKYHFEDFNRKPNDYDFVNHWGVTLNNFYKEAEITKSKIEILENSVLFEYVFNKYLKTLDVCPIDELYTLKISHCVCRNINWKKHVWDIQFLKEHGAVFLEDLFYELYEYWNGIDKNKRSFDRFE